MAGGYAITEPSKEDSEPFPIPPSDGVQYDLMGELGTDEMRVRMWYFEPGESGSYHRHGVQEELYYVDSGTATVRLGHGDDEEVVEVPAGSALRVAPETPRELGNEGDEQLGVLAVSAPNEMEGAVWDDEQGEFLPLQEWFQRG